MISYSNEMTCIKNNNLIKAVTADGSKLVDIECADLRASNISLYDIGTRFINKTSIFQLYDERYNCIFEKDNESKLVSFCINIGRDIQNGEVIATLPEQYYPQYNVEFYITNTNTNDIKSQFIFKVFTNGIVKMDAITVDTYCSWDIVSGKYISN